VCVCVCVCVWLSNVIGRATTQAVSPLMIPTAVAEFRSHDRSREICGEQSGTGSGFLRVLRLPFPILIPPNAPY
jgi:hypothetical protein